MALTQVKDCGPTPVSIGIFAWNEERIINRTLSSLLDQSLFNSVRAADQTARWDCEVLCIVNGSTDNTARVVEEFIASQKQHRPGLNARAVVVPERGKLNAWNRFVREFSDPDARYLFMMDADILFANPDTLVNMLDALEDDAGAVVATDQPLKHMGSAGNESLRARLSHNAAKATQAADAQLCGQLYCIRARAARRIHLPHDLPACEDGLIKALVCTDFLAHSVWPRRIRLAPDAAHWFEAYTSPLALLKNRKRQMLGQTVVHILVDKYLPGLRSREKQRLAENLREKDKTDPAWLRRLICQHLRETRFCWRLYPGMLQHHFKRLANLPRAKRLRCLPTALLQVALDGMASLLAGRALRAGALAYWPEVKRKEPPTTPDQAAELAFCLPLRPK